MRMAERHADQYGTEPQPRAFTKKERELLRADPAFAEWLDQLELNRKQELNNHVHEHQ